MTQCFIIDLFSNFSAGNTCVEKINKDGVNEKKREMGPKSLFGELAILYNTPRTASIRGECFCQIITNPDLFIRFGDNKSLIGHDMCDKISPGEEVILKSYICQDTSSETDIFKQVCATILSMSLH